MDYCMHCIDETARVAREIRGRAFKLCLGCSGGLDRTGRLPDLEVKSGSGRTDRTRTRGELRVNQRGSPKEARSE